ncbi:glycosyltransferase family 2 protein [Croceibacterium sp. TMG7-5b_MA50]|uniref:glycosyltransferase family 2 protein n=1 Tax=Croceibacterium sp. TMG7-5b_MA50 TaxID=3121290 RepID=UPI003221DA0C
MGTYDPQELVSVIVPAFNAGHFIHRTLQSIVSQTHRAMEIIVVDDGSTDDTAAQVERWSRSDPRIRLVRQDNAGVAAARNAGIAQARGRYVAPVDADDLWAPDKLEQQLTAASGADRTIGLVYGWYVQIDEADRVARKYADMPDADALLPAMCRNNILGSGSLPLLLREAVIEVGGYDASLRARNAQGCEDYRLYFSIIERYATAIVPAYLLGYRIHGSGMSTNVDAMMRSRAIVTAEIAERHPLWRRKLQRGNIRVMRFTLSRLIRHRRWNEARVMIARMMRLDAAGTMAELGSGAWLACRLLATKIAHAAGAVTERRFAIGAMPYVLDEAAPRGHGTRHD